MVIKIKDQIRSSIQNRIPKSRRLGSQIKIILLLIIFLFLETIKCFKSAMLYWGILKRLRLMNPKHSVSEYVSS